MDRLWAPWRLEYLAAAKSSDTDAPCFLCRAFSENDDDRNHVVLRTAYSAVVLNRYPYNNGHLLVAPLAHKASLESLDDSELLDGQKTLGRMMALLTKTMNSQGFNVGLNLGEAAGAGLPGHLHWHVVPRWVGDTNFMPALAGTKVISQSLEALYELLTTAVTAANESKSARAS
jgi:ATP adenylyltransferase